MTLETLVPEATHQEKTILGVLLLGESEVAFGECEGLHPHMFALHTHQTIFAAIQTVFAAGLGIHTGSVWAELERRKQTGGTDGFTYLLSLTEGVPFGADVSFYVGQVKDRWQRREAQRLAITLTSSAADLSHPIAETLAASMDRVMDALSEQRRTNASSLKVFGPARLQEIFRRSDMPEEQRRGLTYGHSGLDEVTFGAFPGETTVIGARSGIGKSALMLQAVHANIKAGIPCCVFSLEMTSGKCMDRLLALESGVPFMRIREGELGRQDKAALMKAYDTLEGGGALTVHDTGGMPLVEMLALARVAIRRDGAKLVTLDYLQIANAPGRDPIERVARTSRAFTDLCKNEGVHGLLLSQLRKPSSKGDYSRPEVSDLRETGQIENDASVIVLAHRRFDVKLAKWGTEARISVPKARDAEQSSFLTRFCPRTVSFVPDNTVEEWEPSNL